MKLEKLQSLLEQFIENFAHRVDEEVIESATIVINSIAEQLDNDAGDDEEDLVEVFENILSDE